MPRLVCDVTCLNVCAHMPKAIYIKINLLVILLKKSRLDFANVKKLVFYAFLVPFVIPPHVPVKVTAKYIILPSVGKI